MAEKEKKKRKADLIRSQKTKRCWSCNTHMNLEETHCPSCKRKVGSVNEHGVAEQPTAYVNYFLAFVATAGLIYFLYYAFIKN